MIGSLYDALRLIPPPGVVRAELARRVREARRLRSLLRLAMQAEEDRRFLNSLAEIAPKAESRGEVGE